VQVNTTSIGTTRGLCGTVTPKKGWRRKRRGGGLKAHIPNKF